MKRMGMWWLGAVLMIPAWGLASGVLVPKDAGVPPLAIRHHRVDVQIRDGAAEVRVEEVFRNATERDLEAVYVFPLPENAAISDFALYIGGKRVSGELLEKEKARDIYRDIVRRMKDPGLLEHMGGNLFRVSVYPVPKQGDQRIELSYSQTLDYEAGLYRFVYPLKTGEQASRTLEDFTVGVRLQSTVPVKSLYSPSHEVGISRKGENEAVIGLEQDRAILDKDFVLYYGVSKKDFGLNLLTHAAKGADGYSMMMLAPTVLPPDQAVARKDVVLVFDTSGSMSGKKIEQACNALKYCVGKLNDGDRFNVVRFSTDVESWSATLKEVTPENRKGAMEFVGKTEARGGTAVDGALAAALGMDFDRQRPGIVLFLTDGKPTIGETDAEAILANVTKWNSGRARLFVFGVGDDVNTHLLDTLSSRNGGLSQYVRQDEDIEVKVSSLADKITYPVLSHPKIQVDKMTVRQVHPAELPDLFCGEQLLVFGRYQGEGHVAIRLTGEVQGQAREFVYEGTFPAENAANDFIPRLWAVRRVGYLLDEIRLHGEDAELKGEVIRLGKEFAIMTPYTSYLVLEDDKAYAQHGVARTPAAPATAAAEVFAKRAMAKEEAKASSGPATVVAGRGEREAGGSGGMVPLYGAGAADGLGAFQSDAGAWAQGTVVNADRARVDEYLQRDSGSSAVQLSEAIRKYKTSERSETDAAAVRQVGKRILYLVGGRWVDSSYRSGMKERKVPFAGDEYFRLLDEMPDLRGCFALGPQVTVVLADGSALVVE